MNIFTRKVTFLVSLITILFCHNLNVPLENFTPHIIASDTCLIKTLFYPDSTVCTLYVEDLNDTALQLSTIISDTAAEWPGACTQLCCGYDMKEIALHLSDKKMDVYQGMLVISDEHEAADTIPYRITKILRDTFGLHSPDTNIWDSYRMNDIMTIKPDYLLSTYVLKFLLDPAHALKSTGVRTAFGLKGNFCVCINFGLIELSLEKLNGVKVSFTVSTSHDTAQWAGAEAGLYLQGIQSRLRLRAAKGLDSKQFDIDYYSGNMRIERSDTAVSLFCWKGNPNQVPEPIKTVTFSAPDTVLYVHLKMSVDSLDCLRYCIWDNFSVNQGMLCTSYPLD